MIRIRTRVAMPAPADEVWALLTDWSAHSRWIPATTVTVLEDAGGVGTRFVGRSALGPLGFDDPMTVTSFLPPDGEHGGRCDIRKTGSVVMGTASLLVDPDGPTRCTVQWWEDVTVAPERLTRYVEPLIARVGAYSFAKVLRAAAAELAAR